MVYKLLFFFFEIFSCVFNVVIIDGCFFMIVVGLFVIFYVVVYEVIGVIIGCFVVGVGVLELYGVGFLCVGDLWGMNWFVCS